MEYRGNRDINKIKTTVTLKLGTKNRLLDIAKKGESFDDVINRLIGSNEMNESIIAEYELIMNENSLAIGNKISVDPINRGVNSIRYGEGIIVKFSYNKPGDIIDNDYCLEAVIEDVYSNDMNMEELLSDKEDRIMIYFRMIEKIINIHFDPSYSIPGNKNLLDTHYWRKVWNRVNLNDHSFDHDINRFITGTMEEFNE